MSLGRFGGASASCARRSQVVGLSAGARCAPEVPAPGARARAALVRSRATSPCAAGARVSMMPGQRAVGAFSTAVGCDRRDKGIQTQARIALVPWVASMEALL
jgi:hypothetical protein